MPVFHPLHSSLPKPGRFTFPFCYTPHPLCLLAAKEVERHIATLPAWEAEVAAGKMFGVLVCQDGDGQTGFIAAYSGQIGGREDWPWFVPAVFDYLQPDGYFRTEEAAITAINHRISALEQDPRFMARQAETARLKAEADEAIDAYKTLMQESKQRRDEQRPTATPEALALMERESQHQKAERRRLRRRWQEAVDAAAGATLHQQQAIHELRQERRYRSDALQRWLFDQFRMLNARGERRTLTAIFADTPQQTPPSGAGECCAPKLLQYAFLHRLRPLCMAEFWQGRSPQAEVRHHGQFYPACRGKCKPILDFMLQGLDVDADPRRPSADAQQPAPTVVYADDAIVVVDKPAGMPSVPGLTGQESVEDWLRRHYPQAGRPVMVHRLDQDTSGLLVCALTADAYHDLQRQFRQREVEKRYVALLQGCPRQQHGTVCLPLRPDPLDRPRQVVDPLHGKSAVTDYTVMGTQGAVTRVSLTPHTGRTHQLRVHCAHAEGLATPIVGDPLYGLAADTASRMCLHAESIAFLHPVTHQPMRFTSPTPF